MRYSSWVLAMAFAVSAQDSSGNGYGQYFLDSLSFELDLQEHIDPDNNANNVNLNRVSNFNL